MRKPFFKADEEVRVLHKPTRYYILRTLRHNNKFAYELTDYWSVRKIGPIPEVALKKAYTPCTIKFKNLMKRYNIL